ncbi:MAG: hypothetical protein JWM16_2248 [Verrucomicrobiales bacterium]|nr:hypothetical protein [Verrucomicrobiales bacterium]
MKLIHSFLCLLALLISPAFLHAAQVQYVVQVSLDGLGAKYLENYLSNAPAQFPNFVRLVQLSASTMNARCDFDISETIPNHTTIFTGRPVLQPTNQANTVHHGYNNNFPGATDTVHAQGNPYVPYKSSFFDIAHDYGLSTALYSGKARLLMLDRSYDAVNGAADLVDADNGKDKIDYASVGDVSGTSISNEVNSLIANLSSATPYRYSFIHIAEPDITGHSAGWGSANWSNAVRNVDTQLGRIIDVITTNSVLSNATALIVSADHGGGGVTANAHTEAYHIKNYTIPFFLWAPKVPANSDVYALFANRGNPGTNRLDYNAVPQPLRNADGSNLALGLLGLPPIPGSSTLPILGGTNVQMNVARALDGAYTAWWPATASAFVLETSPAFAASAEWAEITNGIINNGGMFVYSFTNSPTDAKFYRLRKR